MSLTRDTNKLTIGLVLLAPASYSEGPFHHLVNPKSYDRFLAGAQRLRGEIYVMDGAILPADLTDDGRYLQHVDVESWHLLVVNDEGGVEGCIRYGVHTGDVLFSDVEISHHGSMLRSIPMWPRIERAIQSHVDRARLLRFAYIELGGWALSARMRCTTEAVRMVLMIYAFGRLEGGAYGLGTVTTRHHSSSILRRLGGASLVDRGENLPPYYDPEYACEMELLTFDSTKPNPRYSAWIDDCHQVLSNLVVIVRGPEEIYPSSLLSLAGALSDRPSHGAINEGLIASETEAARDA